MAYAKTLYRNELAVDSCKKLVVVLTGFRQRGNDSFAQSQATWESAGWHTIYIYLPDHESEQQLRRGRPREWDEIVQKRILEIWQANGEVPIALAAFSMGAAAVDRFRYKHPEKIERVYYAAPARRLSWYIHLGQFLMLLLNTILLLAPLLACIAANMELLNISRAVLWGIAGFVLHRGLSYVRVPTLGLPDYEWGAVGTTRSLYNRIPLILASRLLLLMFEMWRLRLFSKEPSVPMLLVHGRNDWVVPLSVSRGIAKRNTSKSTLIVVDGAKHDVLVTHWDEIAPAVKSFFEADVSKKLSGAVCRV